MKKTGILAATLVAPFLLRAGEADLRIPDAIKNETRLYWGFFIIAFGLAFGLYQFFRVKKLPSHRSMLEISDVIFKTCVTYLKQQGKFLAILFLFIGAAVAGYFGFLAKGEDGQKLFGIGGVLTKLMTAYLEQHGQKLESLYFVLNPIFPVMVAANVFGLFLLQMAFQNGRAAVIIPVQLAVVNGMSVLAGMVLFSELISSFRIGCILLIIFGTAVLQWAGRKKIKTI